MTSDRRVRLRTDALPPVDPDLAEESRYANLTGMSLEELMELPPPPARYRTEAPEVITAESMYEAMGEHLVPAEVPADELAECREVFDADNERAVISYRKILAARYARCLYQRLFERWHRPEQWPARTALRAFVRKLERYCVENCVWLSAYTPTKRIKISSAFLNLQIVLARFRCLTHGIWEPDTAAFRTSAAGRLRGTDLAHLCALEMVANDRPLHQQSAAAVFRTVRGMCARVEYVRPCAAALDEMERLMDALELWLARRYIVTASDGDALLADCPVQWRQRWFGRVETQAGARWAVRFEYLADLSTMLCQLRRQVWMHRFLCFPRQPPPPPSPPPGLVACERCEGLPQPYHRDQAERLARLVYTKMSDPSTFLEKTHTQMTQMMVRLGEMERYERAHNCNPARRAADLLHYVRGNRESAYWLNKAAESGFESMWGEEISPLAHELFLHELVHNDYRSRSSRYDWKRENVLYASGALAANLGDAMRFVEAAARRTQPFLVQSLGCFLLVHQGRCYRTEQMGEALALWFWLVRVDALPSRIRRLTHAYRRFLWEGDADALQCVDEPEVTSQAPSDEFVQVMQ